jgi:hypothetical protein
MAPSPSGLTHGTEEDAVDENGIANGRRRTFACERDTVLVVLRRKGRHMVPWFNSRRKRRGTEWFKLKAKDLISTLNAVKR